MGSTINGVHSCSSVALKYCRKNAKPVDVNCTFCWSLTTQLCSVAARFKGGFHGQVQAQHWESNTVGSLCYVLTGTSTSTLGYQSLASLPKHQTHLLCCAHPSLTQHEVPTTSKLTPLLLPFTTLPRLNVSPQPQS